MIDSESIKKRVRNTVLRQGPKWLVNAAKNYPYARRDLLELPKRTNSVAVVVGSGLSLQQSIDELRERQNELDIYCSPTNYSYLRAHGVKPSFLVSVDGSAKQGYVIGEHKVTDVPLLACPFTATNLVERVTESYWFRNHLQGETNARPMDDSFGLNRFMQWQYEHLDSSVIQAGCVTNAQVLVAHHLTRENIAHYERVYFAGVDFGWPKGGPTRVSRYRRHGDEWREDNSAANVVDHGPKEYELELDDGSRFIANELHFQYVNSFLILWQSVLTLFELSHMSAEVKSLVPLPKRGEGALWADERDQVIDKWREQVSEFFDKGEGKGETNATTSDVSDS